MSDKKMGRPTTNPRKHKISIRLSDDDLSILNDYCVRKEVNKTEAITKGIRLLNEKE